MFVKTLCCTLRHPTTQLIFQRKFSSAADVVSTIQLNELQDYATRLLRVAIIGTPNAGKSTFINNLMDRKVVTVYNIFFLSQHACLGLRYLLQGTYNERQSQSYFYSR